MMTKAAKTTVPADAQHAPHRPAPEKSRLYPANEPDYRAIRQPERLQANTVIALQRMAGNHAVTQLLAKRAIQREQAEDAAAQRKHNQTGLPDGLKDQVENLSGLSLDDVRVHYNSPKPAAVQALAYTQGTDIHVAPGQERHLPHEAWHVVQQMQGRVEPTMQMKGDVPINDDQGLEQEADEMGAKALAGVARQHGPVGAVSSKAIAPIAMRVVQRVNYVKQTDYTVSETRTLLNTSEGRDSPVTHQAGHPRQHVGRWEKVMAVAEEQGKTKSAFTNTGEQDKAINSALNSQRTVLSAQLDAAANAHTPIRVKLEDIATASAEVLVFKAKKKKGKGGEVKSWVASASVAEKATVIVDSMGNDVDGAIHIQTAYPVVD